MRVTLRDVAQSAGVSIKTVSHVVNREPDASDATRKRAERAIAQLGNRPNLLALLQPPPATKLMPVSRSPGCFCAAARCVNRHLIRKEATL